MNEFNFQIVNCDTDSISFCKKSGNPFTKEQIEILMNKLNSISPEFMLWENDGYFLRVIVLRAKNYILYDGKKIKIKGSSLKSSTLEPVMKQMLGEFINVLVHDNGDLVEIYHRYVKMVDNIKDITPWAKKVTLSPTTYNSTRKNETNIVDATIGTEYKSGDRIYVYTKDDGTLKLAEQFDGDYKKDKYYEKLYKTTQRFSTILDVDSMFLNYKLKKNKIKLGEL